MQHSRRLKYSKEKDEIKEESIERFEYYVDKNGANGCWLWNGGRTKWGGRKGRVRGVIINYYGMFDFRGKKWGAHRVSYTLYKSEIPEGFSVCHKCDNSICVNPEHLFLGTQKENILDCMSKGRWNGLKGEECSWSKLTEKNILDAIQLRKQGYSINKIAETLGVPFGALDHVYKGDSWKQYYDQFHIKIKKSVLITTGRKNKHCW